jgi:hypothetical protein
MAIESECPEVTVLENTEHPSINALISQKTARTPFNRLSFPKTGSFEVYFRGKIIFSKLKLGLWPHPAMVSKSIRDILDGNVEIKSSPQTNFKELKNKPEVPRKSDKGKSVSSGGKEDSPKMEIKQDPKPQAKPEPIAEIKQEIPEIKQENPKPEIKQEAPKAEIKQEVPKIEIKEEAPKAEIKQEVPKAEIKQEVPKAEVKEEVPKAELKEEVPKPELKQEVPKPEVKEEVPKHEINHEIPKPEISHEVHKPDIEPAKLEQELHEDEDLKKELHEKNPPVDHSHHDHEVKSNHPEPDSLPDPVEKKDSPEAPVLEKPSSSSNLKPLEPESHTEVIEKSTENPDSHNKKEEIKQEKPEINSSEPVHETKSETKEEENEKKEDQEEEEEYEPDDQYSEASEAPPYEITETFNVELPVGQGKNVKLPIKNEDETEKTFLIQVSNSSLVNITDTEVVAEPGTKKKLKMEILAQEQPGTYKCYVVFSTQEAVVACYEIVLEIS